MNHGLFSSRSHRVLDTRDTPIQRHFPDKANNPGQNQDKPSSNKLIGSDRLTSPERGLFNNCNMKVAQHASLDNHFSMVVANVQILA